MGIVDETFIEIFTVIYYLIVKITEIVTFLVIFLLAIVVDLIMLPFNLAKMIYRKLKS